MERKGITKFTLWSSCILTPTPLNQEDHSLLVPIPMTSQGHSLSSLQGRCIDVTLVNPHCTQMSYGPMTCFGPSQDYFPLNSCCSLCQHRPQICSQLPSRMYPLNSFCSWCQQHSQICSQLPSRMLPLIPPTARARYRTTLSLPPP